VGVEGGEGGVGGVGGGGCGVVLWLLCGFILSFFFSSGVPLHLFIFDGIARISSTHYNGAGD
jgi:hypothetical protein